MGVEKYEKSAIRHVRDGSIKIRSCQGKSGSYYVDITLENTTSKAITVEIPRGQVFEQNRFRNVQNLAVKGFYKNVPGGAQVLANRDLAITVAAKSTKTVKLECFCIDKKYSSPGGQDMNICPLISNAAVENDEQGPVWDGTNDLW